jgi:hypothetical protein
MSGLATAGGIIGGGAVTGVGLLAGIPAVAAASLANNTILKRSDAHDEAESDARAVGRTASYAAAAAGTAGTVAAISAAGTVSGLSAAGITSGLAAIGSIAGGGMAAGVVIATAAPAAAAFGAGYLIYKVARRFSAQTPTETPAAGPLVALARKQEGSDA